MVHRIEEHYLLHPIRKYFDRIEQRSCVCPRRHNNAPQMADISEEDRQSCQQHAKARTEQNHIDQQNRQQEHIERRHDLEEDHDRCNGDKREAEVDKLKQNFFQRENHLLDSDLFNQRG